MNNVDAVFTSIFLKRIVVVWIFFDVGLIFAVDVFEVRRETGVLDGFLNTVGDFFLFSLLKYFDVSNVVEK